MLPVSDVSTGPIALVSKNLIGPVSWINLLLQLYLKAVSTKNILTN